MPKLAESALLAILLAIAACIASCSANEPETQPQAPGMSSMASMPTTPAAVGSCQIDAIKMCQESAGTSAPSSRPAPATMSYGPSNLPESVEFQIPAGQTIKLMCYYDPQHTSVYRADATPESALSENSVEYMKKQGFCK